MVKGKRGGRKPLTEFDGPRFEKVIKRLRECSVEVLALKNAMKARGVSTMRLDHYAKLTKGIKGVEKFCSAARSRLDDMVPQDDEY
ncbi:MAG TPA: hypothetical protein VGX76_00810 [Pirellulales bacterium]|jgi:hypothetical protein|nr:hypothetical protein [Pirellulales bacterium]HEV3020967.1 hypothetical protein [Pirellulales bacterium]